MNLYRFGWRYGRQICLCLTAMLFLVVAPASAYTVEVVNREGFVTSSVSLVLDQVRVRPGSRHDPDQWTQLSDWLLPQNERSSGASATGVWTVRLPDGMSTGLLEIRRTGVDKVVVSGTVSGDPIRVRLAAGDSRNLIPWHYQVTAPDGSLLARWSGVGALTDTSMRNYRGRLLAEPDSLFDSYWKRNRAEVQRVDPDPVLVRIPERDTTGALFFRVELNTTEDTRIAGWFMFPRDAKGPVPAIMILPGYGAEEPPSDRSQDGFATLALSPRGHGPSRAFGWKPNGELLLHGITTPETYFYVRAIQDAIQGVRFLDSHSSISLIGVEGGSQGGMLALATAANCTTEVVAVCSNVPCFSDYRNSMGTALAGPHRTFMEVRNRSSRSDLVPMNASMGLSDGAVFAARVRQPLQVVMGSLDVVSPVLSGFAIVNQSPARTKSMVLLADEGHALPLSMQQRNREWFRKHLRPAVAAKKKKSSD